MMISGMIPIVIDVNGIPLWINRDVNSPRAFRPARYAMEKENKETVKIEVNR